MQVRLTRRLGLISLAVAVAALAPASVLGAPPREAPRVVDLATQVEGRYAGDVISDARGSSRSDVAITVTRIGPNRVRVESDYARLPAFEAALSRYMPTIQNVGGDQVFLYDPSKSPPTLDITVDDASWASRRE